MDMYGGRMPTMYKLAVFVFAPVLLSTVIAGFGLPWGACTVNPAGGIKLDSYVGTETANPNCMNGTIWWNYPKGRLQVKFDPALSPAGAFCVCLTSDLSDLIDGIDNLTSGGPVTLTKPTKDSSTCVKSSGEPVTIQLTALKSLVYMTALQYSIEVTCE